MEGDAAAAAATIFYFHGFPGSHFEARLLPGAEDPAYHVRYVSMDRPGFGQSSHDPERTLLDWPGDVLAVADHLHVQHFFVWGVSGGGPYAMACARAIPRTSAASGRLLGVAVVSGLWPVKLGTQGMPLGPRMMLLAGAWLPRAVTGAALDFEMGCVARNSDTKLLEAAFDKNAAKQPTIDRECMEEPNIRQLCIDSIREAFRQGSHGAAQDLMLYGCDWGFSLVDIDGRGIHLWHGRLDKPVSMVEKAGEILNGSKLHILEGESHSTVPVKCSQTILDELLGSGSYLVRT